MISLQESEFAILQIYPETGYQNSSFLMIFNKVSV